MNSSIGTQFLIFVGKLWSWELKLKNPSSQTFSCTASSQAFLGVLKDFQNNNKSIQTETTKGKTKCVTTGHLQMLIHVIKHVFNNLKRVKLFLERVKLFLERIKVDFLLIALIFCKFSECLKEFNKFDIVGNPRSIGILQRKILWKKEELKLKKMKIKIFNFYVK